jgi:hypothetical protein
MKTGDAIRLLWAAVEKNRSAQSAPFAVGEETRPITFPTAYFGAAHWSAVQQVSHAVRRDRPSVYNRFAGPVTVAHAIIRALDGEATRPTLTKLIELLDAETSEERRWLVGTPVANLAVPNTILPLSPTAALCPTEPDPDWQPFGDSTVVPGFDLRQHLGDWLSPRPQWIQGTERRSALDTRVTAMLVSIEEGTLAAAREIARTRTGFALGMWTLALQPDGARYVWPADAVWGPQPHLDLGQIDKPFEPGLFTRRSSQSSQIIEHGSWVLPDDEVLLRAPFSAMQVMTEHHSARAVLAASRALYRAARFPSDLTVTERHLHLYTAIATLCEAPDSFSTKQMLARWQALSEQLGLHAEIVNASYRDEQITQALVHLKHVRDMAAHGADSVLVDLGYPAGQTRRFAGDAQMTGEVLSRAMLLTDLRPLLYILRRALRDVAAEMHRRDWDDDAFEALFD